MGTRIDMRRDKLAHDPAIKAIGQADVHSELKQRKGERNPHEERKIQKPEIHCVGK